MKSAVYDASVLQVFADQLYEQAQMIVFWTAVRYGFWTLLASGALAAVLAAYAGSKMPSPGQAVDPSGLFWIVLILTAVAVVKGISDGRAKSFALRLEAQRTLCQMQVELNTRPSGEGTAAPPSA